MLTAEELLKQARSLNEDKKYAEVVELLKDSQLVTFKNADLFAEKAEAYYRLTDHSLCMINAQNALLTEPAHAKANNYLGNIYTDRKEYEKAKECYNLAIKTAPNFERPYNGLGNVYSSCNEFEKAIEVYNKAIEINPGFEYPYSGLGITYYYLDNHDKAIECFNKAIEINPSFDAAYGGLGAVYYALKDYEKAIEFNNKAIETTRDFDAAYFNLGLVYNELKVYETAIEFYNKYIDLTKSNPDYFTELAKSNVIELMKLIDSDDYKAISELVNKIKSLLLFKDNCVTHYTSLSVTKILILTEDSLFRLSEGAFLNDTSEGRELFDFLPPFFTQSGRINNAEAKPFTSKPFVGSFVSQKKHDDLTLWRMYGKENKEEARGCAITIERGKLLENLKKSLIPDDKTNSLEKIDEEFNFYRVAYRRQDNKDQFIIPGAPDEEQTLNGLMTDLLNKVTIYLKKEIDQQDVQNLVELLNRVAFLFKSFEYQYEHEVRLVVKGVGFEKNIDVNFEPPRVYINLVGIRPLIERITLGPKVDKAEEWASGFYYSLDKQELYPEILISHLPFK